MAIILSALLLTPVLPAPVHGASSPNVSLERDLYSSMELWAAEGLIQSQLSSIKPFAGSEVGSQLVAALDKCNAMETPSATCKRIQQHYTKLFEAEIAEARFPDQATDTFIKPVETFSVSYKYLDGPFSIYNNEGIPYSDGHNAMMQLQSQARFWNVFSFFVQPMIIYNQHTGFHSIQPNPNPSAAPPSGRSDDESSSIDVR
ncbi:MAG: capsule assembly Wzi family protein, partial [Bacteroidales bacterium]|nr:capsule assembly Wzi family protein [Bacteroidales bacterium]